jgi:subtilisin-like proprotein convertase family protein
VERNLTSELNLPTNNSLSSSLTPNPMNAGSELFVSSASASNNPINVLSTSFSFTNKERIQIGVPGTPSSNVVTPYGSPINVGNVSGRISDISVTLNNLTHTFLQDVSVLLVAPNGQGVVLMSDVGEKITVRNQTLTFSRTATDLLPQTGAVTSGTYRPTNYVTNNDIFPNPAPQVTASSSYKANLSALDGIDPSGTWNLYVVDSDPDDSGALAGGWSLNFSIDGITTNEDKPVTFSRSNNNVIAVSNVDPRDRLQVNLNVTNGVLSLKNRDAVAFVGNGTSSLTMISSITNINAALDGLQFTPTSNFFGTANLEMVTSVLGATEDTNREIDRDNLRIRINSVNNAPVNSLPGNLITEKNKSLVFSTDKGNAISISDVDAIPGRMFVNLVAKNGTLSLSDNTARLAVLGNNTESVIITGSLADVNAALNGMSFNPNAQYVGDASIQISTFDNGNSGGKIKDEQSDIDTLPIYVTPIMGDTDFNGDNTPDILMRNKRTGENRIWLVDKSNIPRQQPLSLPESQDNAWKMEGTVDFDGNGKLDILWRNYNTGQNVIWSMNGNSQDNSITITAVPDADWKIQGLADFDNDRKIDILWRNNRTGENAIWFMDGTTLRGGAGVFITQVQDTNWQMQGVGDFDGDGKTDILWRNYDNGENAIWLMNGAVLKGGKGIFITRVQDTGWRMQGVADFDKDGKMDILWRNNRTGENGIWLMERTQLRNGEGVFITQVPDTNWRMQGIADFDRDGNKDILWRNYVTGQNAVWTRDGASKKEDIFITREEDTDWEFIFR